MAQITFASDGDCGLYTQDNMDTLIVKRMHPDAKMPLRATAFSAGYDLYSLEDGMVYAKNKLIVDTGIAVQLPIYAANTANPMLTCGIIKARSGWSAKNSIEVGAGLIDYDYRQSISVILYNHSTQDFHFKKHTRIGQLVIMPILTPDIKEVADFGAICSINTNDSDLPKRMGGFGSTGAF